MKREVLIDGRCAVIAEVAQAHDGSLGMAHAFIDAIAARRRGRGQVPDAHRRRREHAGGAVARQVQPAGRDALRLLEAHGVHRGAVGGPGAARRRAGAGVPQLAVLARRRSSCSSASGVDGLEDRVRRGQPTRRCSIASAASGRPVLAVDRHEPAGRDRRGRGAPAGGAVRRIAVLQCTTAYPCPPEKVGLNLLSEFRDRYDCPVGLSDHSGTIFPALAAACGGADVLEVHVTLSREMFGPDVPASVTTAELATLVRGVRFIERMRAHPVDKDAAAGELAPMRALFTKSVVVTRALDAGARAEPRASRRQEARHRHSGRSPVGGRRARPAARGRGGSRAVGSRSGGRVKRKVCVVVTARPATRASRPRSRRSTSTRTSSCSSSSPPRRCSIATATRWAPSSRRRLRDRGARLHGARGREPRHDGQDDRPRAARAGDGLRQPEAGRRRHDRRSLRDAGDRRGRRLHEHPAGPRPGRRGHRLDRREGAARRDQARGPAPRLDGKGARARHPHGRGAGRRLRDRLPVDRSRRPCCSGSRRSIFDPFEKYGGVGEPVDLSQRLPRRHAAPGDDRVRAARCT